MIFRRYRLENYGLRVTKNLGDHYKTNRLRIVPTPLTDPLTETTRDRRRSRPPSTPIPTRSSFRFSRTVNGRPRPDELDEGRLWFKSSLSPSCFLSEVRSQFSGLRLRVEPTNGRYPRARSTNRRQPEWKEWTLSGSDTTPVTTVEMTGPCSST